MAEVSLVAVAAQLGKASGEVSLEDLVDSGYTRTFGVSGYLRVNPFEVEAGQADDPASPSYNLADWDGYDHDDIPEGDDLAASSGYGGDVDVTFTAPAGYSRATAILNQEGYGKDTGETTINATALAVNPFDTPDTTPALGDGSSGTISGLTEGEVAAVGVKVEFDDSVTVHTNADSVAYDTAVGQDPLTGAGRGVAIEVFPGNPGPLSVTQATDSTTCSVGDPVDIDIDCDMQGTSTGRLEQQKDGGSWTLVDASVTAGSSTITVSRDSDGSYYKFRLRYNDVSPDDWATQTGTITPTCDLL